MHTYEFTYYGFIPVYNDFDQEWLTIQAESYDEAVKQLKTKNIFATSDPVLTSVDGIPADQLQEYV